MVFICCLWGLMAQCWTQLLANYEFMSGIWLHTVRKRTPRFLVSYSHEKDDEDSLNKVNLKADLNMNEDKVVRVAALTLTEASHREGSHASQTLFRKTEHLKASPTQSREMMVVIQAFCPSNC